MKKNRAQVLQLLFCLPDISTQMCRCVAVTANRYNVSSQIAVQPQKLLRRHRICQSVSMSGCVHFNPFSVFNDNLQYLCNDRPDLLKRINAGLIIALNQIHMTQYTVVFVCLDHTQYFLIITFIVFLLCPPLLRILCPKFLILHLVDGQIPYPFLS